MEENTSYLFTQKVVGNAQLFFIPNDFLSPYAVSASNIPRAGKLPSQRSWEPFKMPKIKAKKKKKCVRTLKVARNIPVGGFTTTDKTYDFTAHKL